MQPAPLAQFVSSSNTPALSARTCLLKAWLMQEKHGDVWREYYSLHILSRGEMSRPVYCYIIIWVRQQTVTGVKYPNFNNWLYGVTDSFQLRDYTKNRILAVI